MMTSGLSKIIHDWNYFQGVLKLVQHQLSLNEGWGGRQGKSSFHKLNKKCIKKVEIEKKPVLLPGCSLDFETVFGHLHSYITC